MKVSTKGRYALRMMVDLARYGTNEYISLRDVAERQEVSMKYMEQIVSLLTKSGFLYSVRGPQGVRGVGQRGGFAPGHPERRGRREERAQAAAGMQRAAMAVEDHWLLPAEAGLQPSAVGLEPGRQRPVRRHEGRGVGGGSGWRRDRGSVGWYISGATLFHQHGGGGGGCRRGDRQGLERRDRHRGAGRQGFGDRQIDRGPGGRGQILPGQGKGGPWCGRLGRGFRAGRQRGHGRDFRQPACRLGRNPQQAVTLGPLADG